MRSPALSLWLAAALCSRSILSLPQPAPPTTHELTSLTGRKLHGKFLHITDFHPDPFFKTYSGTDAESACHRHTGSAGYFGAETSSCDSPLSLVNATFDWIRDNIKDEIDFIIWTGDSARHDNDEKIPRSTKQVEEQNRFLVSKFLEVFGTSKRRHDSGPANALTVPIIPNIGNNDILPHNIFEGGPNLWTNKYLEIWRNFIPEEQRHQFQRGGWFYVEAIPQKLAVFSLNTMYFFDSNSAVDGCAAKSEPGYEQFEWLRIQLQFMRERGMKAILIGHVPPARTENKMSWDETCWQKYALWTHQYRDVILGTMYGHMNIAHFMLQDFNDVNRDVRKGRMSSREVTREKFEDEVSISSATDYLLDLRDEWSKIPSPPKARVTGIQGEAQQSLVSWLWDEIIDRVSGRGSRRSKKEHDAFLDKIGGKWGERYSLSHVQASVVPNYFPTMRVFQYNITGLDHSGGFQDYVPSRVDKPGRASQAILVDPAVHVEKKRSKHKFTIPKGPSASAPPGPAYSPQPLTLVGYTEYFANLTNINNDFTAPSEQLEESRWKEGKHHGKHPHKHKDQKPHPKSFTYEVEYDTASDKIFNLQDLTVHSYLKLARQIGNYQTTRASDEMLDGDWGEEEESLDISEEEEGTRRDRTEKKKKKKKKKHHRHTRKKTKQWLAFVRRAFVETVDPASIESTEFER